MPDTSDDISNNENQQAYDLFVKDNHDNVTLQEKYVVFVNGKFEKIGNNYKELVKKMYEKHGNVEMYVGRVSGKKDIAIISSPRRLDKSYSDNV